MRRIGEVRPSAHYMMGGVRVDANGKSIADNTVIMAFEDYMLLARLWEDYLEQIDWSTVDRGAVFGSRAGIAAALYSRNFNNKKINKDLFSKKLIKSMIYWGKRVISMLLN